MTAQENEILALTTAVEALLKFEKTCAKTYIKFSKVADAPALAKALDPELTNINNHIQRLKIIKKLINKKATLVADIEILEIPKPKKIKSQDQDKQIIDTALHLQQLKTERYKSLLKLIDKVQLEAVPVLIQQSISENLDTTTWLARTEQQL